SPEIVDSQYLAGYQQVPNPEYTQLQQTYQERLAEYSSARTETDRNVARAMADETRQALADTPQYVKKPVYKSYRYYRTTITEKGHAAISVTGCDVESRSCSSPVELDPSRE